MTDIFLSYSSEDREWARCLANKLTSVGFSVWWDRTIPAGKVFSEVISEALDGARCVVVVWSEHSIKSNWVREEAEEGRRRGILVPLLLNTASPPLGFRSIQAVDFSGWDKEEDGQEFQKLLDDITLIIGPPKKRSAEKQLSTKSGQEVPSPTPTVIEPMVEKVAQTRPPDAPPPIREEQRSKLNTMPYLIVGVVLASAIAFIIYVNQISSYPANTFFLPNYFRFYIVALYTHGLFWGLELANRLSRRSLVGEVQIAVLIVASLGVVFLGVCRYTLFMPPYYEGRDVLPYYLGTFIYPIGWTGISLFIIYATKKLKIGRNDTPSNRFVLAVVTGALGGVLWTALLAGQIQSYESDISSNSKENVYFSVLWLKVLADGILLGVLIGFVESVGKVVHRSDLAGVSQKRSSNA